MFNMFVFMFPEVQQQLKPIVLQKKKKKMPGEESQGMGNIPRKKKGNK